jgi:hypothetical protein
MPSDPAKPDNAYWFYAKRVGWGWGAATCWQGWAVYGAYFAIVIASGFLPALLPRHADGAGIAKVVIILTATAALIAICMRKGEPPRWRWGGD